jgi:hypothetical protein
MTSNTPHVYRALTHHETTVWEDRVTNCHSYAQFGRRYRQNMRFLLGKEAGRYTLFYNSFHREYYKMPQWQRVDGDNQPVEPEATETYKYNKTFDDNNWSSSDKEGTLMGYDSCGAVVFCEHRRTGKQVPSDMMVVPGADELKFLNKDDDQRDYEGQIDTSFVPIKKLSKEAEDLDDQDESYPNLSIERTLQRRARREMQAEGEPLKETSLELGIVKTHQIMLF